MKPHQKTEYRLISHAGKHLIEKRYEKVVLFGWVPGVIWSDWQDVYDFDSGLPYRDATPGDYTAAMERLRAKECELRKAPIVLLQTSDKDCS